MGFRDIKTIYADRTNWSFVDIMPDDYVGPTRRAVKRFGKKVKAYQYEGSKKTAPPGSLYVIMRDDDGSTLGEGWVVFPDVAPIPWEHAW